MEIIVSEEIAKWFKEELQIEEQGFIRFFPRYGGGGHIPGFSIGINQNTPNNIYQSNVLEGITFYVEEEDAWYFEDINLTVELDEVLNEPKYIEK